jgi:pyruvate-ferredoxin/flavodoxin oxidoreductase
VAVEDCTGCRLCVEVCPARDRQEPRRKAINMVPQRPLRDIGRAWWSFFAQLPDPPRQALDPHRVSQQQLQRPLFEFSGACAGCGETPYLKLASQLFGDRMLVANATGCSSIYGGSLPTTPWSVNDEGRGPAWSNSLFEDNAEFGYGLRVALDQQQGMALELLGHPALAAALPPELVAGLRAACSEALPGDGLHDIVRELTRDLEVAVARLHLKGVEVFDVEAALGLASFGQEHVAEVDDALQHRAVLG